MPGTAQEKVIRAITFSEPTAHSSPLLSNLKLHKLGDIFQFYIFSFGFECHNHIALAHSRDFLLIFSQFILTILEVIPMVTFLVTKNTLEYGIRPICCNGVAIWNNIPSKIRNSASVKSFGKNL